MGDNAIIASEKFSKITGPIDKMYIKIVGDKGA